MRVEMQAIAVSPENCDFVQHENDIFVVLTFFFANEHNFCASWATFAGLEPFC